MTTVPWLMPDVTTLRRGNVSLPGGRVGQNWDTSAPLAAISPARS